MLLRVCSWELGWSCWPRSPLEVADGRAAWTAPLGAAWAKPAGLWVQRWAVLRCAIPAEQPAEQGLVLRWVRTEAPLLEVRCSAKEAPLFALSVRA